jgi:hypothetical protein
MQKLSLREKSLIFIAGALFPIYPAILIMKINCGVVIIYRVIILSAISGFLFSEFFKKGLNIRFKIDGGFDNIGDYLDKNYSSVEQQLVIKNYRSYKSKFFSHNPQFTRESQKTDPILRKYKYEVFKALLRIYYIGVIWASSLILFFYVLAWKCNWRLIN